MLLDRHGGHILVTGGSSGIGFAIATALADVERPVSIIGRDPKKLAAAAEEIAKVTGAGVAAEAADVTDTDELTAAIARLRERHGPIGVLVNSAGAVESCSIMDASAHIVRNMVEINLVSVFEAIRLVLPDMLELGGGRIINVASVAALKGFPHVSAYCAAKHGVIGLTRSLALELIGKRITVNAVCPGYTDTDLVKRQVESLARSTPISSDRWIEKFTAPMGLGRLIAPAEVASLVRFLAAPGSAGITGQSMVVAGCEYMAG